MSDQEASSSADCEIDENTLTNIPINIDDKDFIKKITKSQLFEIIKNLSKDIVSLKVKPLPTIETQEDKPPNSNLDPSKLSDPSKPSDSSKSSDLFKPIAWDTNQIEAFMRSQNDVNNSFKFNENSQENINKSAFSEKNPFNSRQAGVLTQVITHESENYRPPDKKILKLDPNTPKFHGNVNEDVDDWLYKVKINLEIAQIPADKYFDYLTNYCVGKAGIFMRRLRESYESKFSRMILRVYIPIHDFKLFQNNVATLSKQFWSLLNLTPVNINKCIQYKWLRTISTIKINRGRFKIIQTSEKILTNVMAKKRYSINQTRLNHNLLKKWRIKNHK